MLDVKQPLHAYGPQWFKLAEFINLFQVLPPHHKNENNLA